ncbi:ABC transporter substrate-binding protein [Consotaella salsifontis]|uniref:Peptide/nickel transport system substrate-binding protein n=1 Tax=Consotaella salsifontis TaxID=1365950 RepID=A0A1T4Q199_9HYPH|nr:ABC transporter substrate-binding protein [Consotaella salsifontis]SJZ97542.1 peptide/nickel transport system substrate-binding protein [Consotaella salsifontis]
MKTVITAALAVTLLFGVSQSALAVDRGGTLAYGRYADSLFLEPVLNDGNVDIWVLSNLYDTLILPTDDGQGLRPGLATDWKVSEDGLSVTLTLRDGIKFSDGSPITVDDVKWSLERAAKPDNGIWQFLVQSIDHVETEGDKTVVIKLKKTDPAILSALTVFNTGIMPKKLFEAAAGATDAEKAKAFAEHPVSSGPFMLQSWQKGADMKLAKNPYYWDKGEDGQPLPYLDGIDFQVIPDDATRILKLQSGELQGAEFIPYARVSELKNDDNINMELFPSTRVEYVTLNVRPQLNGKDNPLSNEKFRQALNYATNKRAIIQIVTHGVGTEMTSFMSKATPLHAGDTPLYPYDIAKAKQLMSESGVPAGSELTLLTLAGNQDEVGIATALQQMWQALGVKLNIQQVDNASRTEQYRAGTFQMRLAAWTDDIADPNEITSYFAYSPTIDAIHTSWKNDEVNKLFEQSQSETDPEKRREEYARIQEIFNSTGPIVPLYETPYPVALSKKVHDFVQIPLGNNIFRSTWMSK